MINVLNQVIEKDYSLYNGDSVEIMKGLPDNSIHYSIFSPPFASLYTYSNSERDMGNSKSWLEFRKHFSFIIEQLHRTIMPGRLVSVHCMDIPLMKERDGVIGLFPFPDEVISMFRTVGFIYHSKVTIVKDPLVEATRTKALGLMHKQIEKDSAMCRNGLPDYIVTFRKPGANPEPISHPYGFTRFIGENEPLAPKMERPKPERDSYDKHKKYNEKPVYSHQVWRRYANPVWDDIDQSNTLNGKLAREEKDERHVCPLQLDAIGRCVELWSNEGDIVFSPFGGIGSEPYQALKMGRKAVAIELKESYYNLMVRHCEEAVDENRQLGLF